MIYIELNPGPRAPVFNPTSIGGGSWTNQDRTTRPVCLTRQHKSDLPVGSGRALEKLLICLYVFMRTTVDLPDPLFKQIKAEAALRGMKLREFIMYSLERTLTERSSKPKSYRVKLPLVRGNGKRLINPTREQLDASLWDSRD